MTALQMALRRFELSGFLKRPGFRLNLAIVAIVVLYALAVNVVAMVWGLEQHLRFRLYSELARLTAGLAGTVFLVGYTFHLLFIRRPARPLTLIVQDIRTYLMNPVVILTIIVPFLALPVFMSMFTSFKSMIPAVHPFSFDVMFWQLDRVLHGGVDPWRITHALFGSSTATMAINFAYNAWFFIMWGFVYWQMLRVNAPIERARYLTSFILCWAVIGSLFALLLSSAGPCYYDAVLPGEANPYSALMNRLDALNAPFVEAGSYWKIWSIEIQQRLWVNYSDESVVLGSGISAMPSMHVSVAVLMALGGFRIARWFGWVMVIYAIVIQIGSVHLGWHYAVDGYLAAILTIGIWYFCGWLVNIIACRPNHR